MKTGGYKVSALEIEEVLRAHPRALQCVSALPRNALGKVIKREVTKLFRAPPGAGA